MLDSETEGEDIEIEDLDQDAGAKHCATQLEQCPVIGCAEPGNGEARSNEIKHGDPKRPPPNARPMTVPIDAFRDLQIAADALMPQGKYPPPAEREKLRSLNIRGHKLGEGYLVKITGYLKDARAERNGESVNCKIKGVKDNDFHLSIVVDAADEEFAGIVAEMIPQDRPDAWTPQALDAIRKEGRQVLITGHLFYDAKHRVNAGPQNIGGQPKRFSLWEVHPVQRFFVCTRAQCAPSSAEGWRELK